MAEFISSHSIYAVMLIVLICWAGIFFYLLRLGRRVSETEQRLAE